MRKDKRQSRRKYSVWERIQENNNVQQFLEVEFICKPKSLRNFEKELSQWSHQS
jgi:hypothetical protein